ncbi:hypothetical protein QJS10_CPB18g01008 [Acorus calamus]|uniref:MMS19 nucleotide excision repair protein n=1 Tax=Acorus calamus TaxID=4465 RepID=A0AAV9CPE0_ACOCL|nr:hypothetical protein QJS10_CPB18g01008 [Acorus calamus]
MAKPSSWIPHVEAFVDSSRPPNQHAASLDAIAALMKGGVLTIEESVREMELYLVTTDNIVRSRGILLLAELLLRFMLKPLDVSTIHSLIEFFTSRMADWQALRGALIGCLALLRRKDSVGMVSINDARALARSYLKNLQVQSLALQDRKLCFELLECLLDKFPDAVVPLGEELVTGVCEAIDEEKDPRCLILTFRIAEILLRLFPDPLGPVANLAEDIFDILGRYFPIYFTHPKTDDLDIKRDDLSRSLMHVFSSTPFFEPYAIPLLLEKLSSAFPIAKVDSLKYLSNCTLHYGVQRMEKHAKALWSSLRDTICACSPQEYLFSLDSQDTVSQGNEVAKEALLCLHTILLHFDGLQCDLMFNLIIEDDELETIFNSVSGERHYKDFPIESWRKLNALASILSVSAKISSSCCSRVFEKFFSRLMIIMGISSGASSLHCYRNGNPAVSNELSFGALCLCVELLAACRELAVNAQLKPVPEHDKWCCMLQNVSSSLAYAFGSGIVEAEFCAGMNQLTGRADNFTTARGLEMLGTFPGCNFPITEAVFENILMTFMSIMTSRCEDTFIWNLALKSLVHIGAFIGKFHDSEKELCYMRIVVEKIVSLLPVDDSALPLSMKLKAAADIGTTGLSFMMKINVKLEDAINTEFLKAFGGVTHPKAAENLIHLLNCYSKRVIPWCHENGKFEELASSFAINIWNLMEANTDFNIGIQEQGLLDALAVVMSLVVAGCRDEYQNLIVQKAHAILSSRPFFELMDSEPSIQLEGLLPSHYSVKFCCKDEWIIALFASVVTALRPQTILPNVKAILNVFTVFLLLRGHVSAAQALGSMMNKWPTKISSGELSDTCNLEEASNIVFKISSVLSSGFERKSDDLDDNHMLCHPIDGHNLVQIHAVVGLAWIGKGLLMRGHEKVKDIIMVLLKCLLSLDSPYNLPLSVDSMHDGDGKDMQFLLAKSAADAFHVFLSESDICLNKKLHARTRPLYKQHFFSTMMPILVSSIKECVSSNTRSVLYRAFGHIISDTPLAALLVEAKKLIPSLLDGLSVLSVDVQNKDLIYSLLLVLSGIIVDDNGKEAITENAHTIINLLVQLVMYPHMMLVRETAIQCLIAMSALPHALIYPMRLQVLQAVSKALNDRKRPVRQEAVRCRQAWASMASRSLHF